MITTRILVPTDFSDAATQALAYASRLARTLNAELSVLHVVSPATHGTVPEQAVAEAGDNLTDAWLDDARASLTEAIASVADAPGDVRGVVSLGLEADEIVQFASHQQIDLIVMGRHGHGRVARWLYGSVTDHVLRRAACPVLAIPATQVTA